MTRPLRFAHVSDTHLGYRALFKSDPATGRNQRAVDIERAYEIAIEDILARDVQLVIHAGDVFHHTRPAYSAMRAFVRQTRKLVQAGLPVVVIGGNHDTPRLRTSGSVFSVLEETMPEVRFVTGYEQETVPFDELDLAVHCVPHGKLVDPLGASAFPEPGRRNILVTHGLVGGVALNGKQREPGEESVDDVLLDAEFDYIALGHYHVFSKVRHNAWYSGATERMGFGDESASPGYAIVELGVDEAGARVTHIPIEARPMRTLPPVDGEGRSAREIADVVLERLEHYGEPTAIARVELRNTIRHVRREAEKLVRHEAQARELVWSIDVFTRSDLLIAPGERRLETGATDIRSLFQEFVGERNYEPAFATAFAERGARALDDAIRAQEAAAPEDGAA